MFVIVVHIGLRFVVIEYSSNMIVLYCIVLYCYRCRLFYKLTTMKVTVTDARKCLSFYFYNISQNNGRSSYEVVACAYIEYG